MIGIDLNRADLERLQKEYTECDIIYGDVGSEQDIKSYSKVIAQKHKSIDILVNNAASSDAMTDILSCSSDQFQDLQNINIMGTFWNCKLSHSQRD